MGAVNADSLLHYPFNVIIIVVIIIIKIFNMPYMVLFPFTLGKLRLREFGLLNQIHTAKKEQKQTYTQVSCLVLVIYTVAAFT